MKYVTKNNVEVEVLHAVFKSIDDDDIKKFGIQSVEFNTCSNNIIGYSYKVELLNGQNARYGDYIVRYQDGTCHVYNKELFNMLFQISEHQVLIEKMILLCERVKNIESKHNVFIVVPKKYRNDLKNIPEVTMANECCLKYMSGIETQFMGIMLEFEDVNEPYIKIK